MPTYQYRCSSCSRELEVVQKFTDPALTQCPSCDGALRKVFSAVGVVFKGSGFYTTDARGKRFGAPDDVVKAAKKGDGAASTETTTSAASTPAPAPKPDKPKKSAKTSPKTSST